MKGCSVVGGLSVARRFARWLAPAAPLLALVAACSTGPALEGDPVGHASSPIINGTADSSHPAVVALVADQGLCSGTIVKVDAQRRIGWVATAAHCVEAPLRYAVQANDFNAPGGLVYTVLDYEADSRYGGVASLDSGYDFAMVRILGVDATTPVLPLTTAPDGVSYGTAVKSVGYGRTSHSTSAPQNSVRRIVQKSVDEVNSLLIGYDNGSSGICQGDSGGPVLVGSGASERVVGIHSFGADTTQDGCDGRGYSGRVVSGLDFFGSELDKALPAETCDLCKKIAFSGKSECRAMTEACFADPQCKGYNDCIESGKSATKCFDEFPLGEGPILAAASCACDRACTTKCATSPSCASVPRCGYARPKGSCATCVDGACCAEQAACAADGQCYACLKTGDADAACSKNGLRSKLAACIAGSCATECVDAESEDPGGTNGATGGDDSGEDPAAAPAPATTVTTTGCNQAPGGAGPSPAIALAVLALAALRRRRAT